MKVKERMRERIETEKGKGKGAGVQVLKFRGVCEKVKRARNSVREEGGGADSGLGRENRGEVVLGIQDGEKVRETKSLSVSIARTIFPQYKEFTLS